MKVRELIEELKKVDPEREVIMSRDSEGNGHTPLCGFWEGSYVPDSEYSGAVYYDSMDGDPDPEDVRIPGKDKGATAAIILSPTW
jgi:hypothetical protein